MASRPSVRGAGALLLLLGLAACDASFVDEAGLLAGRLPPGALVVDRDSVGGPCDDARAPDEARSYATPWCSLDRALEAAPRGATVQVRRGAHPMLVASASSGRSVELALSAAPLERVEIAGMSLENQSFLRFQGFAFTEAILLLGGVANVHVTDCELTSSAAEAGVFAAASVDGFSLERCTLHAAGRGVSMERGGSNLTFRGNLFLRLAGAGLRLADVEGVLIEGNELPDSDQPWFVVRSSDVVVRANRVHGARGPAWLHDVQRLVVENNVLTGFSLWAMSLANVPGARLVQNTIWANGKGGVELGDDAGAPATTGVVVQNNLLQTLDGPRALQAAFAFEDYNLVGSGFRTGAHDLAGAPLFVDSTVQDFHLAPASGGVDAALADGAPERDARGAPRVDDPRVPNTGSGSPPYGDLGALEGTP